MESLAGQWRRRPPIEPGFGQLSACLAQSRRTMAGAAAAVWNRNFALLPLQSSSSCPGRSHPGLALRRSHLGLALFPSQLLRIAPSLDPSAVVLDLHVQALPQFAGGMCGCGPCGWLGLGGGTHTLSNPASTYADGSLVRRSGLASEREIQALAAAPVATLRLGLALLSSRRGQG